MKMSKQMKEKLLYKNKTKKNKMIATLSHKLTWCLNKLKRTNKVTLTSSKKSIIIHISLKIKTIPVRNLTRIRLINRAYIKLIRKLCSKNYSAWIACNFLKNQWLLIHVVILFVRNVLIIWTDALYTIVRKKLIASIQIFKLNWWLVIWSKCLKKSRKRCINQKFPHRCLKRMSKTKS